ncbi:antA/AntB antirepressor family protein [Lacrimispora sp. 210928-DFI.3.58]|uniref:antA/AntB antirepressor family protein n=1 Tax=Lacrimispora sp. 210928-DFI.3.58 TaxID=2883214 RepID=UPI001D06C2FC|nr:antA/AntB antirepressor family protein [Lacrimispora sp. 210928-DFI.3.58]MCB7320144.1 antA/AntB antirepressor family protein [Lacrimispora sp. 210928-DFI.3.58]
MNDIFNEVFGKTDTSKLTPIEIALGIDNEGRTTATKLYDFLELNPSNYSKWYRKNILENEFAEENVDYFPFVLKYESLTGEKERQDAKLTASFAKKLSMMQKNQKGEAARNYFVGVENGTKKLIEKLPCPLNPQIASSVAELGRVTERIMYKQGSPAYKIAEAFKMECEQFGIQLPADFVKVPEYIQLQLSDFMKG